MKSNNPYESPEATAIKNPVRGRNYFAIIFRFFVIMFWVLIPVASFVANIFLKPYYDSLGIGLPLISEVIFNWKTPFLLSILSIGVISAMIGMRPGIMRFCLALIAVLLGLMVILACGLAYWMPWASIQAGLGR